MKSVEQIIANGKIISRHGIENYQRIMILHLSLSKGDRE